MKTNKRHDDFYAEDFNGDDYVSSHREYYADEYSEPKEYNLESLNFLDDGFTVSLRVVDLSTNEDYLLNKFIA